MDWFSFGTSNQKEGAVLNEGLITQKEEFGGSACVFDFYEFDIPNVVQQL